MRPAALLSDLAGGGGARYIYTHNIRQYNIEPGGGGKEEEEEA